MPRLYRAIVQFKLEYFYVDYGSTKHAQLHTIDTIHYTGIRITTGAFRSCPVNSLLCEAGEPRLHHRRFILPLRYADVQ